MGSGTRRSHDIRSIDRITAKFRSREYQYRKSCFFEVCICVSSLQPHGNKHSKSLYRLYHKTNLLYYAHYNRQRKRFYLPSYTRISRNTRHKFETCHNRTCTNHRGPRTGSRHNQDFIENGFRRISETMAQVFTHCNPEIQHNIPLQYRL